MTQVAIKGKYAIGLCNYEGNTRPLNRAGVEWELTTDGNFSASGYIWNTRMTDHIAGGQMLDELVELFPNDEKLKRIHTVWKRWHLNDMRAGSPRQEAFLTEFEEDFNGRDYTAQLGALEFVGLSPDEEFKHNGKPYKYGSAWLKEELPQDVIDEIASW